MIRHAIVAVAFAAFAVPASAASVPAADAAALEQLKNANDAAWNRKDVATIAGQYVEDASVRVAPGAELVSGRDAITRFFTQSFARRDGEFRHITTLAHLEPLDASTVLGEGDVRLEKQAPDGSWTLVRRFRSISVVVRDGGKWKLRSVRAIPLLAAN